MDARGRPGKRGAVTLPTGSARRAYVRAMFGRIARRYDLMNTIMTFGLDRGWRRLAVWAAHPPVAGLGLDVGAGTGRLSLELARMMPLGRVVGVDFTLPMLRAARATIRASEEGEHISLVAADALALPFDDGVFDCVLSAFTVRNLADVAAGFREQARVTRPGGRVVCLELSMPPGALFAPVFRLYFRRIVPILGRIVAGAAEAYTYLPESVAQFPRPRALAALMRQAGLRNVRWRRLALGAVCVHVGEKAR